MKLLIKNQYESKEIIELELKTNGQEGIVLEANGEPIFFIARDKEYKIHDNVLKELGLKKLR